MKLCEIFLRENLAFLYYLALFFLTSFFLDIILLMIENHLCVLLHKKANLERKSTFCLSALGQGQLGVMCGLVT